MKANSLFLQTTRAIVLLCAFATGMTALILQVVWHKKLAHLIGGDSLAQAMSVGVFLLGLSFGYFTWGLIAQKIKKRISAILAYALCECTVAVWCLIFPLIFGIIQTFYSHSATGIFNDFIAALCLLAVPAFFMGGSIPLLIAALPQSQLELPWLHSVVYGFNTIGAAVGSFLTGFYLIPQFGLNFVQNLAALINILVAITLFIATRNANLSAADELTNNRNSASDSLQNQLGFRTLTLIALQSGFWTIGLEIIYFRITSISLGASSTVYSAVVGIFILGLGIGALTTRNQRVDLIILIRTISLSVLFISIALLLTPYLNLWSHIISNLLRESKFGFTESLILNHLLYWASLLPGLFYSGRVLPQTIALLSNENRDPKHCGKIYFMNTLGCFLGSIGIGYIGYHWFSLIELMRVLIFSALIVLFLLHLREKKIFALISLMLVGPLILLFSPTRNIDVVSLHEFDGDLNFFDIPKHPAEVLFLKDDPLATISVLKHPANPNVIPPFGNNPFFYTIHINGKNDGGTYPDSLTTTMLATLPYLFHKDANLKVAVIGLGTGVTAGMLAQMNAVAKVDVIEISDALIEGCKILKDQNYSALENPKVKIIKQDAFRFFSNRKNSYDIIISEPSSIWSIGSEALYTHEFNQLIYSALTQNGIFANWLHLYYNNHNNVFKVLRTLFNSFDEIHAFLLAGGVDLGMILHKGEVLSNPSAERFQEPAVNSMLNFFGFKEPNNIFLNEVFHWERKDFKTWDSESSENLHTLDLPTLAYKGFEERFKKSQYEFFRDPKVLNAKRNNGTSALFSKERSEQLLIQMNSENQNFTVYCQSRWGTLKNPNCAFFNYLNAVYKKQKLTQSQNEYNELFQFGVFRL